MNSGSACVYGGVWEGYWGSRVESICGVYGFRRCVGV